MLREGSEQLDASLEGKVLAKVGSAAGGAALASV
jgi:hypothetical protein